jgi:hypothetical protein
MVEAEIIKGLFEASEIPVELVHESLGTAFGFMVGALGEVEIWVLQPFEAQARALLANMENGALVSTDDAPPPAE